MRFLFAERHLMSAMVGSACKAPPILYSGASQRFHLENDANCLSAHSDWSLDLIRVSGGQPHGFLPQMKTCRKDSCSCCLGLFIHYRKMQLHAGGKWTTELVRYAACYSVGVSHMLLAAGVWLNLTTTVPLPFRCTQVTLECHNISLKYPFLIKIFNY